MSRRAHTVSAKEASHAEVGTDLVFQRRPAALQDTIDAPAPSSSGNLDSPLTRTLLKEAQTLLTAAAAITGEQAEEMRIRGMQMLNAALSEAAQVQEPVVGTAGPDRKLAQSSSFGVLVQQFASNRNEAIEIIRKGLPASVLKDASEYFGVPLSKIRAIVRLPESTAARLAQRQGEVDAAVSERIWRLADVVHMATDVFEDDEAAKVWLRSPNRTFLNSAPMDYLDTEPGARSVRQVLNAIATGGAA